MVKTLMKALIYAGKTLRETLRSYEKLGIIFVILVVLLVALAFMYGEQSTVSIGIKSAGCASNLFPLDSEHIAAAKRTSSLS